MGLCLTTHSGLSANHLFSHIYYVTTLFSPIRITTIISIIMILSHLGNPRPGPGYIGLFPQVRGCHNSLRPEAWLRSMNASGLIIPGVGLANFAPADWGMAHSPYTKRDSLYTGYTLTRYTFLIDKLREEDGQLRLWKIGILESTYFSWNGKTLRH